MTVAVRSFTANARDLHALALPERDEPAVWVLDATHTALVAGSAQRPEIFDAHALSRDRVELAERRSGGGAVFIDPASTIWIDVLLPSRWGAPDMGHARSGISIGLAEAFGIVGRAWGDALTDLGVHTTMSDVGPTRRVEERWACWAGIGWGELVIGDRKVVGLSQRRTRWGTRVQSLAVFDDSVLRAADYFAATALAQADVSANQLRAAMGSTPDAEAVGAVSASIDRARSHIASSIASSLESVTRR